MVVAGCLSNVLMFNLHIQVWLCQWQPWNCRPVVFGPLLMLILVLQRLSSHYVFSVWPREHAFWSHKREAAGRKSDRLNHREDQAWRDYIVSYHFGWKHLERIECMLSEACGDNGRMICIFCLVTTVSVTLWLDISWPREMTVHMSSLWIINLFICEFAVILYMWYGPTFCDWPFSLHTYMPTYFLSGHCIWINMILGPLVLACLGKISGSEKMTWKARSFLPSLSFLSDLSVLITAAMAGENG